MIAETLHYGDPWWVSFEISAAGTAGAVLVTPKDINIRQQVTPSSANTSLDSGPRVLNRLEHTRLVLLGYHYDVVAAASGGFDLFWRDFSTDSNYSPQQSPAHSPSGPPGSPHVLSQHIIRPRNPGASAARIEGGCSRCFLIGTGGHYSPYVFSPNRVMGPTQGSPEAIGLEPAQLVVAESGASAITSGTIVVWGIEVSGDWRPFKSYTGSPVDMGA